MLGDDWKTCDVLSLATSTTKLLCNRPVCTFSDIYECDYDLAMTRIDHVLECAAIPSDHTSAWIRTKNQSHAKLDSYFTMKTANAKVRDVFDVTLSHPPSFPIVADINECTSLNGGCSRTRGTTQVRKVRTGANASSDSFWKRTTQLAKVCVATRTTANRETSF